MRLRLRAWRESDLGSFAALNADPAVMEYFPKTLSREESDALAGRIQAAMKLRGFGQWAVEVPGVADDTQPLTVRRVGKRAPVELLLVHHFLQLLGVVTVGVDADEGKGLAIEILDERPLVGP